MVFDIYIRIKILLMNQCIFLSFVDSSRILLQVLELALVHMLEGRHVSDTNTDTFSTRYPELHAKYWIQLQMLLKKMLATILSSSANKTPSQPSSTSSRFGDGGKIKELYKMSLKGTDMIQLHKMHNLWIS